MPVFLSLLISMKSQSISELVSVDVTELSALFVLILGVFFFSKSSWYKCIFKVIIQYSFENGSC